MSNALNTLHITKYMPIILSMELGVQPCVLAVTAVAGSGLTNDFI